jgi:hypothetical protein
VAAPTRTVQINLHNHNHNPARPRSTIQASGRGAPRDGDPRGVRKIRSRGRVGNLLSLLSGFRFAFSAAQTLRDREAGGEGRGRGQASRRTRPQLPSLRPRLPLPPPLAAHDELLLCHRRRRRRAAPAVLASGHRRTSRRGPADGGRRQGGLPRGPVPRGGARQPSPPPHEYVSTLSPRQFPYYPCR